MLFGFCGTPQSEINLEGNGRSSGATRLFEFAFCGAVQSFGRTYFDYDNVNVVKPDSQGLATPTTSVAYNGNPKTLIVATTPLNRTILNVGNVPVSPYTSIPQPSPYRFFQYNSSAVLSPLTRKIKVKPNYYFTKYINLGFSIGGVTTGDNIQSASLDLNLNQLPFLEYIVIQQVAMSTINLKCNNPRFKTFYLFPGSNFVTTINGKLPASTESIFLLSTLLTNLSFASDCVNLKALYLGYPNGGAGQLVAPTVLTGTVDISYMVLLRDLFLPNSASVTSYVIPASNSNWERFLMLGMSTTASTAFNYSSLDSVLQSPNLKLFSFINTSKLWNRNIGNADIATGLVHFYLYANNVSGNISITTAKPALKSFLLGNFSQRTGTQLNSFPTVDITGLTGATTIDLSGCNISDLQLPVNTVCATLNLFDNKIDRVTNPNFISQVNAMTALITCEIGIASTGNATAQTGQNSTNGIGSNPDLSGLVNCTTLSVYGCGVVGTLTIANVAKLQNLYLTNNTGLTGVPNFSAHATTLLALLAINCPSLSISITNAFTVISTISLSGCTMPTFDMSGKTSTVAFTFSVSSITCVSITLPSTEARCINAQGFTLTTNPTLATITNLNNINYPSLGAASNFFAVNGNPLLDITFPFGVQNFIPRTITIQNNGMSTANVNATIDSIYSNATKWDTYSAAKTLNIAGTNSVASGIYQFNATPTTAKEKIYYLVNTKGWTITYN